jgi:hypothetical protein
MLTWSARLIRRDKILQLLEDLGDTQDEIAAFLAGQGISDDEQHNSGMLLGRSRTCPIARYLRLVMGEPWAVHPLSVEGPRGESVGTPSAVRDYIRMVDGRPAQVMCSRTR